jgi:AraC family transcriptional regulator, regulatory protein of adaptative response / DNA-3-methyladenine glycosylase II
MPRYSSLMNVATVQTAAGRSFAELSPGEMYERFVKRDASYDGGFFTGVLTTGIYCLPSCRARKPLPRNVRFFPDVESARGAGLRPCRRCHPDDFALGLDPVIEQVEALAAEVDADPSRFPDVQSLLQRSGYGATRLFELFRLRYGLTPAAYLLGARLRLARRLLAETDSTVSDVAFAAGFRALSVFHEHFKRSTGGTPGVYRALNGGKNS